MANSPVNNDESARNSTRDTRRARRRLTEPDVTGSDGESFRVTRVTVHDQVRTYLEQRIRDGSFQPGSALPPERELADRLGVSRHSLRQALASLEAMGVIETRHGSGVYLQTSPSEAAVVRVADALYTPSRSMADVVEARLGVEPYIAQLATLRRDEHSLKDLHTSIQAFDRMAESSGDVTHVSASFHQMLARLTGNAVFEGLMRSLLTGPQTVARLAAADPDLLHVWHDDHTDIFLAVADRDERRASKLMAQHLEEILTVARTVSANGTPAPAGRP